VIAAAGVIARLVRIDARRPASWCVAGVAAASAAALASDVRPVAAVGCGLLLGAAAIGGLARDAAVAELIQARIAARLVWPILGGMVGLGLAGSLSGAGPAIVRAAMALMTGGVAATGVALAMRSPVGRGGPMAALGRNDAVTGQAPLVGRSWIDAVAMASTLVAMAVCFFLVPEAAGWYAVLAASWFTLLAVPVATLAGGDETARGALLAASAGGPRLPGSAARSLRMLVAYAAVLAWPAAVAAVVTRGSGPAAEGSVAAIAAIAVLLAVAAAAVAMAAWRRWGDDTPLTTVALAHALAAAVIARVA
jgi:hypothetical protein